MAEDDLVLEVGGRAFEGWEEVSLTRSLEAMAGSFSLKVSDRANWPIPSASECVLRLGDEPLLTGFVDSVRVGLEKDQHSIEVEGRDRTGDLIDCAALNEPGSWQDVDPYSLISEICDPYGVIVVAAVDLGDPFYSFALQPGETCQEAIERACRLRALLPTTDGRGRLVLTRARQVDATVDLVEGQNLLSLSLAVDESGRYRDYVVRGQQQGSDLVDGSAAAGPEGRAQDLGARAGRTLIVLAEGALDGAKAARRAAWEASVRAARASVLTVLVQGWRETPGGPSWNFNRLVRVHSPTLGLHREVLVTSVRLRRAISGGTTAELALVRPDAYQPERVPTAEDDLQEGLEREAGAGEEGQ